MTTAMKLVRPPEPPKAKARRKGAPRPMTLPEAERSVQRLGRLTGEWATELVAFAQREGWKVLGYPSIRHCLADRLKIGTTSALHVLRAAGTKTQVAALAESPDERSRILNLSDVAALRLRRLDDPKRRLLAFREAETEAGHNGGRVSGALVSGVIRRMTGAVRRPASRSDRLKCPRCSGAGWIER